MIEKMTFIQLFSLLYDDSKIIFAFYMFFFLLGVWSFVFMLPYGINAFFDKLGFEKSKDSPRNHDNAK